MSDQQEEQQLALETRQQRYLRELGEIPDSYQTWFESLTGDQQRRIRGRVNRTKHGLHAVAPLTCLGPTRCPMFASCPIPEDFRNPGPESDYPIGQPCVLEHEYMIQRIGEYCQHLDVDPGNPVESSIVQELALLDLQKNRALLILSNGDAEGQGRDLMHVDESITGLSEHGPLISRTTKIHPVLEQIDKLERRREKWLDRLMETRKAKADWAAKMGHNTQDSRILVEVQQLREALGEMLRQPPQQLETLEPITLDEQ